MKLSKSIVETIKQKFQKYETYYDTLGIKNRDTVTDEEVKEAYERKINELNAFFSETECKEGYSQEIEELKNIMLTAYQDAYSALKTLHSRKNYQDLLDSMEGFDR